MGNLGADAMLVGESLVVASDVASAVRQMSGLPLVALKGEMDGATTR